MPIVTISRGTLSGGARLAESLGARLGLRVLSREVMVEAAKTYGLPEELLRESLQSPPGFWDRQARRRQQYILAVQAALANMVEGDDVVFHGLAGQLLLRELPSVLKVRLIAPMERRIRNAMVEADLTREEAERRIQKADEEREAYVKRVYDVDVADPTLYDLVLNLEHMGMETATEMVVDLLGRKEFRSTPETLQLTKDFALACRVRAELSLRSHFPDAAAHVSVSHGVVTLDLPGSLAEPLATTSLLWGSLFSSSAVGASRKPVGSVMSPIRATVSHDDTLGTVVSTMLEHDVDLVPVTDGAKTVGVVLMTDVFDNVAEYVLERSAK